MAKGVNVYLQEDTCKSMEQRNKLGESAGSMANREIARLYYLYDQALREVSLSVNEACLLCDLLNGTIMDERSARMLWAEVEDGCSMDGLDGKWEVNATELVKKLRGITNVQALALVDATDQFWASDDNIRNDMHATVKRLFKIK